MKQYELSNGLKMPSIGLGTYKLNGAEAIRIIREAINLGYTHIDTADYYRNHKDIGAAIKDFDRKKLFITTKVWSSDLSYDRVIAAANRFLKELNTDYIDLLLIHWPGNSDIKQTLEAFNKLYNDGKIKAIGVSNFNERLLGEAVKYSKITVNQIEFNLDNHPMHLVDYCNNRDIQVVAYSPLNRARIDSKILNLMAEKYSKTPSQVMLRWILDKGIAVIPKASSIKHLKENIDLDFDLSKEDSTILDNIRQ